MWWKRNFALAESYNTTFGTTPNAATFDPKFREKRLSTHENPNKEFIVFDKSGKVVHYDNFMMVLQEEVKVCCTLRSGREP